MFDPSYEFPRDRAHVDRLSQSLREQAAHLAAAEYVWLRNLEEFDRIRGWGVEGCRSPVQWLSWACGIGPEAARERIRVARALPGLPVVCESFGGGELSYSKVRAITRIATPETEALLVQWAKCATAAQLERIVRGVRKMQRIDEAAEAQTRYGQRYVHWHYDDDGMLVISARLPAEDGAVVVDALEAVAGAIKEKASAEPQDVPDGPTRFEGIGELPELSAYAEDPSRLWPARRADALRLMAEASLEHGLVPRRRRPELVVNVDAGLLSADGDGDRCQIQGGQAIAAETARRLACDASVVRLLRGPDGAPLDVGRATRTIPPALRRALLAEGDHPARAGGPRQILQTRRHRDRPRTAARRRGPERHRAQERRTRARHRRRNRRRRSVRAEARLRTGRRRAPRSHARLSVSATRFRDTAAGPGAPLPTPGAPGAGPCPREDRYPFRREAVARTR